MNDDAVRVTTPKPGTLLVELDRPDRHNAIDLAVVGELTSALGTADVATVIIASTRSGTFCSGADVTIDNEQRATVSDRLYQLYELMIESPAAIIAAVDGPAIGGGAQLAVACDVRIVSPRAYFRFVGAGHGLAVGGWALSGLVGRGRAFELCATMREVGADEALSIGLATSIADDPVAAALALVDVIVAAESDAVARIKRVINIDDRLTALRTERTGNRQTWDGRLPPRS